MRRRIVVGAFCALGAALALALSGSSVSAQVPPCDFSTGGGYIYPEPATGAKGTFAAAGGCKNGSYWGHLQYKDKSADLTVQWTSITAYMVDTLSPFPNSTARLTCGTATTNLYGDVDFAVRTKDGGEPGFNDEFDIRLKTAAGIVVYSTFERPGAPHKLGGGTGGGGNLQLHKPNPIFGGPCPAAASGSSSDVTVSKSTQTAIVSAGSQVSYDLVVDNAGPATATNVTVTDSLPTGPTGTVTWAISPPVTGCSIAVATQILSCAFASLAPGVLNDIPIHVQATPSASECSGSADPTPTFSNQASVTASNEGIAQQGNNTSGTVTIRANCIE